MLEYLSKKHNIRSFSISPENFTGEKGKGGMATMGAGANAARDLGQGWKVSPCVHIPAGETFVMGDVKGSGAIKHIWLTYWAPDARSLILRFYWDGHENPSVEVPLGDFFASASKAARFSGVICCLCWVSVPSRSMAITLIFSIFMAAPLNGPSDRSTSTEPCSGPSDPWQISERPPPSCRRRVSGIRRYPVRCSRGSPPSRRRKGPPPELP